MLYDSQEKPFYMLVKQTNFNKVNL